MSLVSDDRIYEIFRGFDVDNSGVLEKKELRNALFLLGIDLTEEELQSTYCLDGDPDTYTLEEFTALIRDKIGDVDFMQRLLESLLEFDEEGTGVISKDKMKQILTMRGSDPLDDEDADEFLNQLPFDEEGSLDCSELAKFVYNAVDEGQEIDETSS